MTHPDRVWQPVVGFVNERKLQPGGKIDPRRVALLQQWLDAGLELGNHTFSHPDLHRVDLKTFQSDVLRGEVVTKRLLAAKGEKPRYFRHPFLHTGRSLEVRDGLHAFLKEHGYTVAPLVDRLRKRGYRFVSLGEALKDPAYASKDEYVGPAGMTWLHRWALTAGKRGISMGSPRCPSGSAPCRRCVESRCSAIPCLHDFFRGARRERRAVRSIEGLALKDLPRGGGSGA